VSLAAAAAASAGSSNGKTLMIVESPTKATKIQKFLGDEYKVSTADRWFDSSSCSSSRSTGFILTLNAALPPLVVCHNACFRVQNHLLQELLQATAVWVTSLASPALTKPDEHCNLVRVSFRGSNSSHFTVDAGQSPFATVLTTCVHVLQCMLLRRGRPAAAMCGT
jgi:hypothetical protein